jgi:hypothetical protein
MDIGTAIFAIKVTTQSLAALHAGMRVYDKAKLVYRWFRPHRPDVSLTEDYVHI